MKQKWFLILGIGVLISTPVLAEIKTLFYEFEKSEQWFYEVTTNNIKKVGNDRITYKLTTEAQKDFKLANLKPYDMVLFGTHGIGGWGSYHLEGVEKDLISYVKDGGLILVHSSDDKFFKGDMFPVELLMQENGDEDFEVTAEGRKLGIFDQPNKIKNVIEDDTYQKVDKPWVVLAQSKGKNTPHTLQLKHGLGEYIVTPCRGDGNKGQAESNQPFFENLIHYLAKRVKQIQAVDSAHKLAVYWGEVKTYR
ncbi:MAG: hypothetical protein QGH37_06955 [Candidatus Poribacteria bacterium]|jgi:hypothetical protein|nr:hypothetical protein [Candidatus Poribacteria bacterium]